jgi:hypothetical protein
MLTMNTRRNEPLLYITLRGIRISRKISGYLVVMTVSEAVLNTTSETVVSVGSRSHNQPAIHTDKHIWGIKCAFSAPTTYRQLVLDLGHVRKLD